MRWISTDQIGMKHEMLFRFTERTNVAVNKAMKRWKFSVTRRFESIHKEQKKIKRKKKNKENLGAIDRTNDDYIHSIVVCVVKNDTRTKYGNVYSLEIDTQHTAKRNFVLIIPF